MDLTLPVSSHRESCGGAPVATGLVFVAAGPNYEPALYNPNLPGGKLLFVPDLGDGRQQRIAAALGQRRWAALAFDPLKKRARWSFNTR